VMVAVRALLLVLAAPLCVVGTEEDPDALCALTSMLPKEPRYLKFCQDYNQRACCIPGHDMENQLQFEFLIDGLGPGCKNPMMYPAIRYFYCLGCDPEEPTFRNTTDSTVRVCRSFVDRIWRDEGAEYDDCGVMKPNDCPDGFDDFDPYTCGDDLIIPRKTEGFDSALNFMNKFKPPGMGDYSFVIAEDDDPDGCWTAKAFSSGAATLSSRVAVLSSLAVSVLLLWR